MNFKHLLSPNKVVSRQWLLGHQYTLSHVWVQTAHAGDVKRYVWLRDDGTKMGGYYTSQEMAMVNFGNWPWPMISGDSLSIPQEESYGTH